MRNFPKYFLTLFFLSSMVGTGSLVSAQTRKIDSLENLIVSEKDLPRKIKIFNSISWLLIEIGETHRSRWYADSAIKMAERVRDSNSLGRALSNLGTIYRHEGKMAEAIGVYLKSLKIYDGIKSIRGQAALLNNISSVYDDMNNGADALPYLQQAIELYKKVKDSLHWASSLHGLGNIYFSMNDTSKALSAYQASETIFKKLGSTYDLSRLYHSMGIYFQKLKQFITAKEYYSNSLILIPKENLVGHGMLLSSLGILELEQGNSQKGIKYVLRAFETAKSVNAKKGIIACAEVLADAYQKSENFEKAFEYYKVHIAYKDSVFNEENTKKTVQQQMQYVFDKKEASTKAEQEKKDVVTKAEQDKKDAVTKIVLYSISVGLLLVLTLAGLIFRGYRQKRKANIVIIRQKAEVERQKQLVEEKQKDILDSIYYAKRIQHSLLPTDSYIEKKLRKYHK